MAISVGLVGFGLAGRVFHAPLIAHAGMRIAAVVTGRREAVAEALPSVAVVSDLEELLGLPDLDVVVIATPSHLHAPQAIAALQSGRHVVVEKPLGLTVGQADTVIAAAVQAGKMLTVFQNRRWDSDFLTLQRLIAGGALGEPAFFEAYWDRFRPQVVDRWRERPQEGGGVLYDLGSHLVDQALCLFGTPDWLEADVFTQRSRAQVDDTFAIRMAFGRLRVSLGARSLVPDHALRYRIHGSLGSVSKSGLDVQEVQLRGGMRPSDPKFGGEPPTQSAQLFIASTGETRAVPAERGDWVAFYRGVSTSIETGCAPPVLATQAREVVRVIEAARRSSREGRRIALGP